VYAPSNMHADAKTWAYANALQRIVTGSSKG